MDISIVIPTRNRKFKLKQCLNSLFSQEYNKNLFEIIVVDDGSTDGTEDMLANLSKSNFNLRFFVQQNKGPASARNFGVKQARGDIIGFTDNDCVLEKEWISKMVKGHMAQRDIAAIGGFTEVDNCNIKAMISQFLSDGAIQTAVNGNTKTIFFPTCNMTIKKEYFNSGFNELFPLPAGEDLEFFWRLYKSGAQFSYRKDIRIFHDCHVNFSSFLKQAYMYGRGNYLVKYMHQDHPLLHEIKTQSFACFFMGLIINLIKIPRFSYISGKSLLASYGYFNFYKKYRIYVFFALHKLNYLIGNTCEYLRVRKMRGSCFGHKLNEIKKTYSKPEFIILDITHRCNLKCNICQIRKDKPIEEFSLSEVSNLIDQAIGWQVKEFVLSGGEPLIREDILDILDYVKEKNYHIGVLTNGIVLDIDFINKLLPYLISNTLSLNISLDALNPAIHDDIRGSVGCFSKTLNALKIISGLKIIHPNINFNVICIILNENLEELVSLANFLQSLNVNSIQFQPLLSNNLIMKERASGGKYWVPLHRLILLDEVIDQLAAFKTKNPLLVRNSTNNLRLVKNYFREKLNQGDVRCLYADKIVLIANNGDVTTCFDHYGNIRKNTLKQIFESEGAKQARENVRLCKNPCLLPCFTDWE